MAKISYCHLPVPPVIHQNILCKILCWFNDQKTLPKSKQLLKSLQGHARDRPNVKLIITERALRSKAAKGNVLQAPVILSVPPGLPTGEVCLPGGLPSGGRGLVSHSPPRPDTHTHTHPDTPIYGQSATGTHPIGMHSCLIHIHSRCIRSNLF